jgi:hypothetical protein
LSQTGDGPQLIVANVVGEPYDGDLSDIAVAEV